MATSYMNDDQLLLVLICNSNTKQKMYAGTVIVCTEGNNVAHVNDIVCFDKSKATFREDGKCLIDKNDVINVLRMNNK